MNIPFEEVVCCDSEFYGREGNRPTVVCLVAKELRSGREFRLWQDQLPSKPPYRIDSQTLFVAHYAAAEMCCHLALGWDLPVNILDTYAEFRCLTNCSAEQQPHAGLLHALEHFKLDSISMQTKAHWRDVVLRGPPWSAEEQVGTVDYCETDTDGLEKLLPVLPVTNWAQTLLRGNYAKAEAWMRHRGIPIDYPMATSFAARWRDLRASLITDLNTRYPFFEGAVFKKRLLEQWAADNGIRYWPRTPTGQLCTDAETLRAMAQRCPQAAEFCHSKMTLDQLKTFELAIGDDSRNRCMLSAYRSKTSRNQPSNSAFVFGLNAAFRSLIKPEQGRAFAVLDFGGQEFSIAAHFSGDRNMIAAYESGDPYSDWARRAGYMPADGDKYSHPLIRAVFKRASLGILYGMGAKTLSEYVGISELAARALLRSHRETFPRFWRWSAAVQDAGIAQGELTSVFGWKMQVLRNARSGTLANFPMQSAGADMLRLACVMAVDRDVPICAPIHDAIAVEAASTEIVDVVRDMAHCMVEASRAVLGGPAIRIDPKILLFPDRYVDGRDGSTELWATVTRLLQRLQEQAA
ncbi:MAG TPA: DNA polymerase [Bradyrhizobium sp.]|jgi:DNA polymerase-1|nr:DNA polymerase [Bradyrhizobium sp.]